VEKFVSVCPSYKEITVSAELGFFMAYTVYKGMKIWHSSVIGIENWRDIEQLEQSVWPMAVNALARGKTAGNDRFLVLIQRALGLVSLS
jgi:hypothetical protein